MTVLGIIISSFITWCIPCLSSCIYPCSPKASHIHPSQTTLFPCIDYALWFCFINLLIPPVFGTSFLYPDDLLLYSSGLLMLQLLLEAFLEIYLPPLQFHHPISAGDEKSQDCAFLYYGSYHTGLSSLVVFSLCTLLRAPDCKHMPC